MNSQNIVFIVIDCLRTDHLGCYGAQTVTPAIDQLAEQGVVFEQAMAMGFHTLTTMPSVMSGCYPSKLGGFAHFSDQRPRLASRLQSLGYKTAAFAPNPYLSRARGYNPGFDHFDECIPDLMSSSTSWNGWLIRGFNRLFKHWGLGIECPPYLNAKSVTERALRWLQSAHEPFFLWIHYMDAHMPYNLPRCRLLLPKGRGQRPYPYGFWKHLRLEPNKVTKQESALAKQLYEKGIQAIDTQVDRLKSMLQELKCLDQTVFVILSDHGEEFHEHGSFGHSKNLYEQIVHIPLILSPRATDWVAHRISAQVRQIDLSPTILELVGDKPLDVMEGTSLLPFVRGKTLPEPLPAIGQTNPAKNWQVSLREPPWKLIWGVEPDNLHTRSIELYHLGNDPGEQKNVADQHPDLVATMCDRLRAHIINLDLKDYTSAPDELDPVVLGRLQALGYVDPD